MSKVTESRLIKIKFIPVSTSFDNSTAFEISNRHPIALYPLNSAYFKRSSRVLISV